MAESAGYTKGAVYVHF
ncbi:hypothetical protein [Brevibacillus parabrevis]